jgi:hypothetical protein
MVSVVMNEDRASRYVLQEMYCFPLQLYSVSRRRAKTYNLVTRDDSYCYAAASIRSCNVDDALSGKHY